MRIRRKFLQLTSWTYPYGTEYTIESYLPKGFKRDENENYYLTIGENPTTMFACHLDTACNKQEPVIHVQNQRYIRTNGKTILGADDKAGMTVLLYMIEKRVPGIYYFFVGEEVGCIGSEDLSRQWKQLQMFNNIKKVVSFDRRGTDSVITHQLYGRCCSNDFAVELSKRLNVEGLAFLPDSTGMITDSVKFVDMVPECTNISVGYYKEHTTEEHQDIEFLQKLCKAVVNIDWETLPVKRDPNKSDYDYYGSGFSKYSGYSDEPYSEEEFDYVEQNYCHIKWDGKTTRKMFISKKRIDEEKEFINTWLFAQGWYIGLSGIIWNGHSLYVDSERKLEFIGDRMSLIQYVPQLASVPTRYLSDKTTEQAKLAKIEKEMDDRFKREYLM